MRDRYDHGRARAFRDIAAYYFLRDVSWGMFFPYYSLALAADHIEPAVVTRIVLIFPVAQMVAAPLVSTITERLCTVRRALQAASGLSFLLFPAYFWVHSEAAHVAATVVFAGVFMAAGALCEVSTMRVVRVHNVGYGAVRMWGALGFCISTVVGGGLIARMGVEWIFVACLAALACNVVQSLRLSEVPAERLPAAKRPPDARAMHSGSTLQAGVVAASWAFFAAILLYSAAHGFYDSGFTLYFHGLGAGGTLLGLAWGTAKLSEIAAFALSERIVKRVGASRLLCWAFAVAIGRWMLLAMLEHHGLIVATQILHAMTMGLLLPAVLAEACRLAGGGSINRMVAWVYSIFGCGQVLGMCFAGALLQRSAFALFATAAAVAVAAAGFLSLHHKRIPDHGGQRFIAGNL